MFFKSFSSLTGVIAAEPRRHLSNMNVPMFWQWWKYRENNDTGGTGLKKPIPGVSLATDRILGKLCRNKYNMVKSLSLYHILFMLNTKNDACILA